MATQPQKSTGEHFSLRLKAFYAALFLTLGVQLPFLPVWLSEISRPTLSFLILIRLILLMFWRVDRVLRTVYSHLILTRPVAIPVAKTVTVQSQPMRR